MRCTRRLFTLVGLYAALAGCTGESVRVVLPAWHPAHPAAAEAPFVVPSDPLAEAAPPSPPPPETPPAHRHDHSGAAEEMPMEKAPGDSIGHGEHGMPNNGEQEGQ